MSIGDGSAEESRVVWRHDTSDMCARCAAKAPDELFCPADEYLAAGSAIIEALEKAYPWTKDMPPSPGKPREEWGNGTPVWRGPAFPEPWGNHPRDRWVRVLADMLADGVWDVGGIGRSCESLPISQALVDRIRAWQSWYDDAEFEDSCCGECPSPEAESGRNVDAFSAEGLAISKGLKAELGPGWTVVYYDLAAAQRSELRCTAPSGKRYVPRGDFEYAVA